MPSTCAPSARSCPRRPSPVPPRSTFARRAPATRGVSTVRSRSRRPGCRSTPSTSWRTTSRESCASRATARRSRPPPPRATAGSAPAAACGPDARCWAHADLELTAERVPINYPAGYPRARQRARCASAGSPAATAWPATSTCARATTRRSSDAESQSLDRLDWQLAALEGGSLADQIALDVQPAAGRAGAGPQLTACRSTWRARQASGTLAQPTAAAVVTCAKEARSRSAARRCA